MAPTPMPPDAVRDVSAAATDGAHLAEAAGEDAQRDGSFFGEAHASVSAGTLATRAGDEAPPEAALAPAAAAAEVRSGDTGATTEAQPERTPPHSPADGAPVKEAIDVATQLVADANAAAEALENLKRLLERGPQPPASMPLAPIALEPREAAPAPPAKASGAATARLVPAAGSGSTQYPAAAPAPARRERSRPDVHGFLAGFALSLAVGALLYLLLTAG